VDQVRSTTKFQMLESPLVGLQLSAANLDTWFCRLFGIPLLLPGTWARQSCRAAVHRYRSSLTCFWLQRINVADLSRSADSPQPRELQPSSGEGSQQQQQQQQP
jgi:hypothetical protein